MPDPIDHSLMAEIYDAIPSHQNRPDIAFYTKLATACPGRVLELGSGTGRILIPIARAGKSVWGLESSGYMLGRCQEVLSGYSREVSSDIKLVQGHMQSFELASRFGLVICPFNSFLHLLSADEQFSCLNCVREHLVPGGKFAFDVSVPDIEQLTEDRIAEASQSQYFELPNTSQIKLRHREKSVDLRTQIVESEIIIDVSHADGRFEQVIQSVRVRHVFKHEAEQLLERSGFEIESLYGDFEGNPYRPVCPEAMVVVARNL